ncbi:MAG: DUF2085 domain-containing protein [Candidatus Lokiarchaeota archaeon]|nr:DUF2085 domain-containing protein [Candidatus Lokiarchaeota archaeon]
MGSDDSDGTTNIPSRLLESSEPSRLNEIKESMHVMLSHHPPSLYGHCLRVSAFGHSLYLCARCAGIYGGLLIGIAFLFLTSVPLTPPWFWFLLAVGLGMATVTDWVTQRLTYRKTTNDVRALSGFISGLGLSIIFMLANFFYMLFALVIMSITIAGVSVLEKQRKENH